MKSARQIFGFLLVTAIFVLFVWGFEVRSARVLILQHRAESFPVVKGKVLSSQVKVSHGSKGSTHYHPSFLYEYQVDGQNYTGRRYRYDSHPSFSESAPAERILKAHPIGSEIEVYYNPANPSDAVLSRRVEGLDIGLLFTGFPFCLLWLYGMFVSGREITFLWRTVAIAGGVRIISERMTTRVRLPRYQPLSWSLAAIGVLSLISGVAMNLRANISLEFVGLAVVFIVLAGAAVYFWLGKKISSGSQDLVIDEAARTVQLPLTYGRRQLIQCAFSDITGAYLEKVAHRGKRGATYTYAPTLQITGREPQRLTDLSQERAESFAAWLREKLGLAAEAGAELIQK